MAIKDAVVSGQKKTVTINSKSQSDFSTGKDVHPRQNFERIRSW
jgi:uncharacterized protein YqfB (UPF0267 family)